MNVTCHWCQPGWFLSFGTLPQTHGMRVFSFSIWSCWFAVMDTVESFHTITSSVCIIWIYFLTLFEWHSCLTTSWSKSRDELNDRGSNRTEALVGWVRDIEGPLWIFLNQVALFVHFDDCCCELLCCFCPNGNKNLQESWLSLPQRVLKLLFNNVSFGLKPCMHPSWFGAIDCTSFSVHWYSTLVTFFLMTC